MCSEYQINPTPVTLPTRSPGLATLLPSINNIQFPTLSPAGNSPTHYPLPAFPTRNPNGDSPTHSPEASLPPFHRPTQTPTGSIPTVISPTRKPFSRPPNLTLPPSIPPYVSLPPALPPTIYSHRPTGSPNGESPTFQPFTSLPPYLISLLPTSIIVPTILPTVSTSDLLYFNVTQVNRIL